MRVKKTIPNMLTVLRIVGVFFATLYLFADTLNGALIALLIYALVAATDFFDGYLARRWQVISSFGKIMDPIADKIYLLTLYVSFVFLSLISHWWVWPIILREVSITVVRLLLLRRGKVVAAEKSGKVKAFTQNISVLLLFILYLQTRYELIDGVYFDKTLFGVAYGVLGLAVFLTIQSGLDFYRNNWSSIRMK